MFQVQYYNEWSCRMETAGIKIKSNLIITYDGDLLIVE